MKPNMKDHARQTQYQEIRLIIIFKQYDHLLFHAAIELNLMVNIQNLKKSVSLSNIAD